MYNKPNILLTDDEEGQGKEYRKRVKTELTKRKTSQREESEKKSKVTESGSTDPTEGSKVFRPDDVPSRLK